jgi:hypothetical protein
MGDGSARLVGLSLAKPGLNKLSKVKYPHCGVHPFRFQLIVQPIVQRKAG